MRKPKRPQVNLEGALAKRAPGLLLSAARLLFLIIVGFIVLYPLLYMLVYSLKDREALLDMEHVWVPLTYHFDNFHEIWDLISFGASLRQTLVVQVLSAAIEVFVCAYIAYGFARFRFRGKPVFTFSRCSCPFRCTASRCRSTSAICTSSTRRLSTGCLRSSASAFAAA